MQTPAGYTFDGWFDENGNLFNTAESITGNLVLTARFTAVTEDIQNPDTADNILGIAALALIGLAGLVGCGVYYKKRLQ